VSLFEALVIHLKGAKVMLDLKGLDDRRYGCRDLMTVVSFDRPQCQ
jgi:hypothetical protein